MTDWVEVTAVVVGPLAAVAITLWREHARQDRERKLSVMRQLLLTRTNASDPAFSIAINLTPIEFGHDQKVMAAWEDFTSAAKGQSVSQDHTNRLVKSMMLSLGYGERAASQVAREDYTSVALVDQRRQAATLIEGLFSLARSSRVSATASKAMAEHVTGNPLPPPEDL